MLLLMSYMTRYICGPNQFYAYFLIQRDLTFLFIIQGDFHSYFVIQRYQTPSPSPPFTDPQHSLASLSGSRAASCFWTKYCVLSSLKL